LPFLHILVIALPNIDQMASEGIFVYLAAKRLLAFSYWSFEAIRIH
jgi:hypothetical protein